MKLFQQARIYAAVIGIVPLPPGKTNKFNHRNVTILTICGIFFTLSTAFILFDAKTFQEYANSFFLWISVLGVYIGFFTAIVKTVEIYQYVGKTEQITDSRKQSNRFSYSKPEHSDLNNNRFNRAQ